MRTGVDAGTIKFTNSGDVLVLAQIYERAFLSLFCRFEKRCQMTAATTLSYADLGWGDQHVTTLAAALSFVHSKRGGLAQLTALRLHYNKIGDAGVETFATACVSGGLAKLEKLNLKGNQIGDVGVTAFAQACASGALASLTVLFIDNPSEQLKAHCSSKSIKLNA
jgi:hypothetical protein